MPKTARQKTLKALEKVQEDFQITLSALFESIGLQQLPETNASILVEIKTAFDLHKGQKYLGVCRPADFKQLEPSIARLEQLRGEILQLKRYFGYTGKLERSFLLPVARTVTARSVTLSVNQTQKIIPLKAGQVRELAIRHPGESFLKNSWNPETTNTWERNT